MCVLLQVAHPPSPPMAQPYLIDIDQILRNKMGRKARFIPDFLVRYLKRQSTRIGLTSLSQKRGRFKACNG